MSKYVDALKEERDACLRAGKKDRVRAIEAELARLGEAPKEQVIETASLDPQVEVARRSPAKKKKA
jgi:hypothetical protein